MVLHICPKCNKHFDKKDSYTKHINRKFSCIPPIDGIDFLKNKVLELEKKIEKLTTFMESLKIVE